MSNVLAIAAVTEALVNLLDKYLPAAGVNGAQVAHLTPDQTIPTPGINVFLYQVTPNTALRNADLPTRAADGTRVRRPQAALDLHYLLTFYGNDLDFEPQRLLGAATLALHAHPVLTRDLIQSVPIGGGASADSHLASQSDLVRITPIAFSLEELSKLWSFLLKIDYVLSAAYVASVVLIEEDVVLSPPALPALAFTVGVQPMRQPAILQVVSAQAGPITAQGDVVLRGRNLAPPGGGITQVLIDGVTVPPAAVMPTSIRLTLPAGLAAGAQTAQVIQPVALGSPPVLHLGTGVTSNVAAFVLSPQIAQGSPPGSFAITVLPAFGSPPGPAIALGVIPTARTGQRVLLQLQLQAGGAGTRLFDGGTLSADSHTVTIPIPGLANGDYLLRVLVDGAQSALAPVSIAL